MMSSNGKKIAVFGSSFDPPHFAHAAMIVEALDTKCCDQVWLCPSLARWDKQQFTPIEIRLEWCEIFASELAKLDINVAICRDELEFKEFRGTFYFLNHLSSKYLENNFLLLLGEDSYKNIHTWRDAIRDEINGSQILLNYKTLVIPREYENKLTQELRVEGGILLPKLSLNTKKWRNLFGIDNIATLSSSGIRQKILEGEDTGLFVFPALQTKVLEFFSKIS